MGLSVEAAFVFHFIDRVILNVFNLQEELSPLQNATHSISSKNKELALIVTTFETYPEENINPLSMVLNGVIDANVNGGISKYQQVCILVLDILQQHLLYLETWFFNSLIQYCA